MNILSIINKKRCGKVLTTEEIEFVIKGYTKGKIPDYQMSSLLMAICTKGMNYEETLAMTLAMKNSGKVYIFDKSRNFILDKHSTGGVGDSTTFIVMSTLASLGYKMVKMSGRGLGHTGGTLDKLEVFPKVKHNYSIDQVEAFLDKNNAVIIGAQAVAPADKKIYLLRDVTSTVESIPLICASILSKKLSCGAHGIVFDITCGDGAFMHNLKDAQTLAHLMCKIMQHEKVRASFVITDMNSPLSRGIGREYEIADVVRVLNGERCALREVSLKLIVEAMRLQKPELNEKYAYIQASQAIDNGQAKQKFVDILRAQGAVVDNIDDYQTVPKTKYATKIYADRSGRVRRVSARALGDAVRVLGGGRLVETDTITPYVGMEINYRVGDKVKKGDCLAVVHYEDKKKFKQVEAQIKNAFQIGCFAFKPKLIIQEIK